MSKAEAESHKVAWGIHIFPEEEKTRRYKAIRNAMRSNGIDCLVITGHHGNYGERNSNLRYVSNYASWFDDDYVLFPLTGEPVMIVLLKAHSDWASRVSWIKQIEATGKAGYVKALSNHIENLGCANGTIGICDFESTPAYMYTGLQRSLPQARFLDAGNMLRCIRMIKSRLEMECMERAANCADQGFRAMLEMAKPGVLDTELYLTCEDAMVRAGAEPPSFILMTSSRTFSEKGYGMPFAGCRRTLQPGDMILDEITASYGGYWAQLCCPIVLGSAIPEDLLRVFEIHQKMYDLAISEIRPGVTLAEINLKLRDLGLSLGCDENPPPWALHHMGLQIMDPIPPDTVLQPSMTFMVHPAAGHHGRYGGHTAGNTVVVTEGGCRILSNLPFQITQTSI